jgi:hypothetical protein
VNAAERDLSELLCAVEAPDPDQDQIARARESLAASLSALSRSTPRAELERILVLHAALRSAVERRQLETARSLEAVARARARCARLTRPHDVRSAVDLDA